jgi:hypothetical protein
MLTGIPAAVLFFAAYVGFTLFKHVGIFPDGLGSAFFSTACVSMALMGAEQVSVVVVTGVSPDEEYVHDLEQENASLRRQIDDLESRERSRAYQDFVKTFTGPVLTEYYSVREKVCTYVSALPLVVNGRQCYLSREEGLVCVD